MILTSKLNDVVLYFFYSRINANAISALIASLDIHPILRDLRIVLPRVNSEFKEIYELGEEINKVIIAASYFSTQYETIGRNLKELQSQLHALGKETVTLVGGPHPSGAPFSALQNHADYVCLGEGEITLVEFLMWQVFQDRKVNEVRGLAYLNNDGEMEKTPKPPQIDLDMYPPFSVKHKLFRPIEITRGCAWKCRFCQIRSKGLSVRHRSPELIWKYVKILVEYFKDRTQIRFISPNALSYASSDGRSLNLGELARMLKGVRKALPISGKVFFGSFPSEVRPETINLDSVKIMREFSDSKKVILGGQSGSDNLLKLSDRGHSSAEVLRATRLLLDAGFQVDVDIIFGLPGELEEDILLTISLMESLVEMGAKIHSHTFMPLVGTPFASKAAGKVNPLYFPIISRLQGGGHLNGKHEVQEVHAKKMENLKKQGS